MTYKMTGLALALTWACMSLNSTHVFAQNRPAAHWSTFNKQANACACHLFARDALMREGLTILEDSGSVLIADNNQVIAQIACKPDGQNQIFVSAFSSDSATAERIRNNVRARIVNATLFDTCP
jgi:hypothetical protein